MPDDTRYYLFKYFMKNKALLSQILIEDAGVDLGDASIEIPEGKLEIKVETN